MGKTLLIIALVTLSLFACDVDKGKIAVVDLECEYLINPMGIDTKSPRLSWELVGPGNNIKQKAYRIITATDRSKLEKNIGDLWDSDTIYSDQSIQIKYEGKVLNSRDKIYWKVGVWSQDDEGPSWSETASWEMGLLNESDWTAKWIGNEQLNKPKVGQKNPARYFRKTFDINSDIEKSRAYISGLGYYELYINGKKVGDHVLSPNQTNYDRRQVDSYLDGKVANMSTRVLYETYDIGSYLQKGENVAAVILGNGWYYQNERSEYVPLYYDTPRFIAQLEVDYADHSKLLVVSDPLWKNGAGPIVDNNLYYGEIYDARLEETGWNITGFDDSQWQNAEVVRAPEGVLHAQMSPPDRVVGTIHPVAVSIPKEGVYRYDFGTMFSGWVRLNIQGNRGDIIRMTFFEDNGNTYGQRDIYIPAGNKHETWEPRFTWHAFRFVEVSGSPKTLKLNNLEGRIVNADVKPAGTFKSSNNLFNIINTDFQKTQLGNMHGGVPSDCPHRERRGYTGDGQIAAQAAIYALDMHSFYTKWIQDMADSQNKLTGYIPNTVPYHSGGGGTPWGSAYIIIPWYMYLYYGDVEILNVHYQGMKKYINYLSTKTDQQGLIVENELGEWVPPTPTEIPPSFVSSAYYYYDLALMGKMAAILGENTDATSFNKIAGLTKSAFNQKYYNTETHSYSIGRQGANVFPLAFDIVPSDQLASVFKKLVHHIEVDTKGHFDTGMMGTPYVLEVLTKYGRADLAYTLMNRRDFPSFGYNIEQGATTLWETWTGKDSHSHPMFGSVCAWFYQGLAGINPDPENPGFKHTIIKPNMFDELDFVHTSYPSIHGDVQSNWELNDGTLKLMVVIPPNTTASVFIPGIDVKEISADNPNARFITNEHGLAHYEISSGAYTFISKDIGDLIKTPMLSIPVIDPPDSTLFSPDSVLVNIRQDSKNAEIRYTLDGSEPNENSSLFTQPFVLRKSAVIKAKVSRTGMGPGFTKTNKIVFIDPIHNGLNYNYYIGEWNKLPDFTKLKPDKTGTVYNINLNEFDDLVDKFAILFTGEIEIKANGTYLFTLVSNDGSKLFIDDKLVIDADGPHSFTGKSGKIILTKGRHTIRLPYFQAGGGKGLELHYEGPDTEMQIISADVLFL